LSDAFGKTELSQLKSNDNACVKEAEAKTHIFVYTEEGLEDNPQDPEGNIRNCYRVTACVAQEKGDSLDCASYNIREPDLCSDLSTSVNTSGYPKKTLNCEPIQVIRGTSGVEIIYTYIGAIYRWGASVVGIIAVLLLVVSGIQISAAAGDQQAVTDAKNRIFQSLAGLAILFLSGIILYTINPTFFVS